MKRVAVLRGGPSEEFEVSLKSGAEVLSALKARDYRPIDVVVTKSGEWLVDGLVRQPQHILDAADVAFLAMHGAYGEDGTVQRVIARAGVPYLGSAAVPSATAFNKALTKQLLMEHDIKMPRHVLVTSADVPELAKKLTEITDYLGSKLVVKPALGGSSIGVTISDSSARLMTDIVRLLRKGHTVLVEEYINGTEATCGVLEKFRDQERYMLPVIEIVPPQKSSFFDYVSKYDGSSEEICPGRFSYTQKTKLSETAEKVHQVMNLTQLSRSDFMVSGDDVYFLEVNTLPGLTNQSLFPKASASVGLQYPDLISHLVESARA